MKSDTTPAIQPIPRQLWIRSRCIAVERQFNGRSGRAAFLAWFIPTATLVGLSYAHSFSPFLSGWITWPITLVAFYLMMLALSHRFHDLAKSAANMLQILVPFFIWLWLGGKLMASIPNPRIWGGFAIVLAIWPLITLLRLAFTPGVEGKTAFEER